MKYLSITFGLLCLSSMAFGQERGQFSGGLESNSQYYVDDSKTGDFTEDDRFRSNNYLRFNYDYKKWFASVQVESYEPHALINYYPKFDGTDIGTFAIGYKSDKIQATLGHFYEQFGSGLVLRFWEDRQLGINNALRGANVKYRPTDYLEFIALYGRQRDGFDVSNGDIYGFNAEVGIDHFLKFESTTLGLGLSYVGRYEDLSNAGAGFEPLTNMISARLNFSEGNIYSSVEYVNKSSDVYQEMGKIIPNKYYQGNAFLLNLGYAKSGLGIDATFRKMENMAFYSQRDLSANIYNQDIINYLPALTKQHDYSLTNIYVYQSQPTLTYNPLNKAGEIGGQIDVYYSIAKETALGGKYGTKLAFNYSNYSGLDGEFNTSERTYKSAGFFSFGEKYYSEVSLEVRKKLSPDWTSIFSVINTFYNKKYVEDTIGEVNATVVVAEATHKFGTGKSIRAELQHLFTNDDKKNWAGGTLEYNLNSNFSFYVSDMYNYGNDIVDNQIHYYNLGGSFTKGATYVGLSYGRQRGGLLCVGGICRYVPENTGFTLNLSTSF